MEEALPHVQRPWSPRTRTEETRSFYQDRLLLFAKMMFFVYIVFLTGVVAAYAAFPDIAPTTANTQHFIGAIGLLVLAFIWQVLLKKSQRTLDQLFYIDTFLMTALGLVFGINCYLSYEREVNQWSTFIWTVFMVFGRVLYVPSSGRRTASLSSLAMGPLILAATATAIWHPDAITVPGVAWALGCAFYSTVSVIIATVGSRVIYGLRKQVRDAQQLGQYTLGRKIGEGGMGSVYEAHHRMLRRPTALKLLPPSNAGSENLKRFEREVQITAGLTHPNTVAVFDYGRSQDGVFYYAMEYLDGLDLDTLVRIDGAQKARRVVHILSQVSGALEEAHGKGLIHRDVKPANILLCERGGVPDFAKVVDFGLVKKISDATQTTGSLAAGTPAYIAPEAVMAPDTVGPPSDIYGLGAVAYYMLTGAPVFQGKTAMELCVHHARTPPTPLHERLERPVSSELEEVIMSCLAKDPKERPQSAADLRQKLESVPEATLWTEAEASHWWSELDRSKLAPKGKSSKDVASGAFSVTVKLSDVDVDWRRE